MAPLTDRPRQIIHCDLDNFYVGCERLRDPSLVGQPIGIKQKAILATCSYEARARGVGKLMAIKEAVKRCPELIIVLGEDLTLYRHYSRLVFNLVRSLLGPSCAVEKLGMDELFSDVTAIIAAHLADIDSGRVRPQQDGRIWFTLAGEGAAGFWYPPDGYAGHRLEAEDVVVSSSVASTSSPTRPSAYLVASHLALHLRSQIQTVIGLSSSAGVSHTKCLAKLIGSVHKPADQTTLAPIFLLSPTSTPTVNPQTSQLIQSFLDPLPIRSVPGFGHSVGAKVNEALASLPSPPVHADAPTVLIARTHLSLNSFKSMTTSRLAPILWDLLHGIDPSPVIASPDFPAQIGVEDSYAAKHSFTWKRLADETERLLTALLVRLEEELVVVDAATGTRRWVRWPKKLRLELRRGWDLPIGREGKSLDMPVGVFDLEMDVASRVAVLMGRKTASPRADSSTGSSGSRPTKVGGPVGSLLRGLVKESDGASFDLYIISFAAVTLSTSPPGPSIERWTNPAASTTPLSSAKGKQKALDLDLSVLDALPADLRAEVLSSYGLSESDVALLLDAQRPAKRARPSDTAPSETKLAHQERTYVDVDTQDQPTGDDHRNELEHDALQPNFGQEADKLDDHGGETSDGEEAGEEGEDDTGGAQPCPACGLKLFPFAVAAHALYHVEHT